MDELLRTAGILTSVSLLIVLAGQSLAGLRYFAVLWRAGRDASPLEPCSQPRAAVVLCLRGGDPFLAHCINGLLRQDYANFEIVVVVDHPDDPAAVVLQDCLSAAPPELAARLRVQYLDPTPPECSLKCVSLVQAVNSLDEDVEIVAQLDADTVPHEQWLADLARALEDPQVGAATGNRWYAPSSLTPAALVRRTWNMGAVVVMFFTRIPWGGTLAIRRSVIRNANLLGRWRRSFCEDTLLFSELRQQGMRVAFVPSLMMVNRESCGWSGLMPWIARQLLTVRLYHPGWRTVLLHGVGTAGLWLAAMAIAALAALRGDAATALLCLAAALSYTAVLALGQFLLEWMLRRIANRRGDGPLGIPLVGYIVAPLITMATPLVHASALLQACVMRRTQWRGIQYSIQGPWQIIRGAYKRYESEPSSSVRSGSL